MTTLEWWPAESNHVLEHDGQLLQPGETFEVSDQDAEEILTHPGTADSVRVPEPKVGSKADLKVLDDDPSQSPHRSGTADTPQPDGR